MLYLLMVLSGFRFPLLRPTQKGLVDQIPTTLPVFLFCRPAADDPFLLHASLLDELRFPGGFYPVGRQDGVNVTAAATSSGAIYPDD
jgi:hypothetical protein